MSDDNPTLGFGKFVPGFDFLQNIAKGASQAMPQMPSLASWIAPTLNVEELEKRIGDLKAVHFWLDQNSKALAATIQALEVQKMTLATLKGMNFSMGELADAMKLKVAEATAAATQATNPGADAAAADQQESAAKAGSVVDPLQWWGALTQQFQQIAADAMKDAAARSTAVGTARDMATGVAREAMKTATDVMASVTSGAAAKPARKAAAKARPTRKAAARKTPARKAASR